MVKNANTANHVAQWLVILGGLNWGLWGIFGFNLVSSLFGAWMWLEKLIYVAIGLSAAWMLYIEFKK